MSIKIKELLEILEEIAPLEDQEDWDNSGLQINLNNDIRKILVSLEITGDVIEEAKNMGVDMIVSHHPLIFKNLKEISNEDLTGRNIINLVSNNISVYSSHTNFDDANFGNNYYLADLLNLKNIKRFENKINNEKILGRMGDLEDEISLLQFASYVSEKLEIPKESLRITGDFSKKIKKIGLCTGAGSDIVNHARLNHCDVFITGDLTHHIALDAKENDFTIIDAGHFGTEKFFNVNMAKQLKSLISDELEINVIISKIDTNPMKNVI